jgi:hypothetical protein
MSMLKEFIQKEHPFTKSKSNESGKCPILPDFAYTYLLLLFFISLQIKMTTVRKTNTNEIVEIIANPETEDEFKTDE